MKITFDNKKTFFLTGEEMFNTIGGEKTPKIEKLLNKLHESVFFMLDGAEMELSMFWDFLLEDSFNKKYVIPTKFENHKKYFISCMKLHYMNTLLETKNILNF